MADIHNTNVLEIGLIINNDVCTRLKCQRTPPDSVFTSNNNKCIYPTKKAKKNARGPGSNPGRDMLFFFAFLVGYIHLLFDVKTLSGGVC